MGFHWVEVPIVVQQGVALVDAESADDQVHGLAHGNPAGAQGPVIRCRPRGAIGVQQGHDFEAAERALDPGSLGIATQALQHLQQDQVTDQDQFPADDLPQENDASGAAIVEVVDPDRTVDDDHRAVEPEAVVLSISTRP